MTANISTPVNAVKHISKVHTLHEFNQDIVVNDEDVTVTVGVTHYYRQLPLWKADNPNDYYGYTEFDYELFDEYGHMVHLEIDRETEQQFLTEYETWLADEAMYYAEAKAEADADYAEYMGY